jgi:hypothetical protein
MVDSLKILERAIDPKRSGFPPEAAAQMLRFGFTKDDHKRYLALSEKAQLGKLSQRERAKLEGYLWVNNVLRVLKAKAKASLKRRNPAA